MVIVLELRPRVVVVDAINHCVMNWLRISYESHNGVKKGVVTLKPPPMPPSELPLNVAINTVHSIRETYPGPYYVMCSGGVDSQAMLWAWHKSNVPFTPVSFQYCDHEGNVYNDHDLHTLKLFSKIHDISIEYKSANFLDFLNNDLWTYARLYECASPQITFYMKLAENVGDGTVIFSGNFYNENYFPVNYTLLGLHRFAEKSSFKVIPFFFLHDANIAHAFKKTNDYVVENLAVLGHYEYYVKDFLAYTKKNYIYANSGFPIIPQMEKYSGFEKIKEYFNNKPDLITRQEKLKYANKPSRSVYDLKYRYPLEEDIPYIRELVVKTKKRPFPI